MGLVVWIWSLLNPEHCIWRKEGLALPSTSPGLGTGGRRWFGRKVYHPGLASSRFLTPRDLLLYPVDFCVRDMP